MHSIDSSSTIVMAVELTESDGSGQTNPVRSVDELTCIQCVACSMLIEEAVNLGDSPVASRRMQIVPMPLRHRARRMNVEQCGEQIVMRTRVTFPSPNVVGYQLGGRIGLFPRIKRRRDLLPDHDDGVKVI